VERYELTLTAHPGALAHVVALVMGRRWSLGRLEYPEAEIPDRRRLVLDVDSGNRGDQVEAQLAKLYDVLSVRRIEEAPPPD
jgi:acetolactate synthase small subunit